MRPAELHHAILPLLLGALMTIGIAGQQVPDDAAEVRPLAVGDRAPSFSVPAADGGQYEFRPAALDRPYLLIFYRGGWCPYCNKHLAALRDAVPRLQEAGYEVLFLSADRPERLQASLEETGLEYRLLSDSAMRVSRAFGIAFRVDDATAERYRGVGIDLEAASGYSHQQLPVPSVFLVDAYGFIRYRHVDPDYKKRLSAEELLAAARVKR